MRADRKDFIAVVKKLYVQDPCKVSALAFWKAAQLLRESETCSVTRSGHTYLYATRGQRLEFYWSDDRQHFLLTPSELEALEFLVLHEDFFQLIADRVAGCQVREIHPLLYDFKSSQGTEEAGDGFFTSNFDFARERDYVLAAEMLNRCYRGDHHSAAEIAGWCRPPVFDESLWIWVKRQSNGKAVGLAISTYEACIRECYLDWVQVLTEYQERGLGRLLVGETIRRAIHKSDIIRVTGVADDFYRKCGFAGDERWRITTK